MTGRPAPFLSASGISAGYDRVPVITNVGLDVGLGEIALVMGPNGAGKSTLVKAMTGELPLLGGTLKLSGADIGRRREEDRVAAGIGCVPQARDVFGPLTVQENLAMGGYRLRGKGLANRQEEMYQIFPQLAGMRRRPARSLSGGERKMLAIARALMARPRLLILDEPTANLAPAIAHSVLHDIVSGLADAGRAIVLVEQRVSLALEVASWGYVLTDGKVRLAASCEELRAMEDLGEMFLGRGAADLASPSPGGRAQR
ncbi:MAG: ABC transporter ATP-binding protein [Nocardiopsaceae bacterium]|jgi:branched-chain amino acid transport system ATP-binding protein|nr:ABC transporter ATP-binding protein [Nocardiopsaceae bacterium]